MRQPRLPVVAALLLAGCAMLAGCATRPKNDPFFGLQVAPAPATAGAQRNPPPQNYYNGGTGTAGNSTPSTATNPRYAPPGGFNFGSGTSGASGGTSGGATNSATRSDSGFRPITRSSTGGASVTSQPAETENNTSTARQPAGAQPLRSTSPEDKPPAQRGTTGGGSSGSAWPSSGAAARLDEGVSTGETAVRQASSQPGEDDNFPQSDGSSGLFRPSSRVRNTSYGDAPASGGSSSAGNASAGTQATAARRPADMASTEYGYDPQYRWLRGKLEYMQASRRWKLRYIPVHGETDDYGGSVILADAPELDNYAEGEFVSVQGRVEEDGPGGFSPTYRLSRIEPAGT
ncbi:MAG: hypothetical protein HYS13_13615 [Planctomycetia bacterium]|nr:hypothetical protein [Planctomycetia bacterium]